MGISTTREMATTIMAIGVTTITTPQGQMAITMATTMTETTMSPRKETLVKWNALSATKLGIMKMIAHRRRRKETNQIHSRIWYVNHINVEEIYDEPDAVYGMFLLNKFSTLVLFNTGASHSFISRAFLVKNKIPTETIGCPIRVSSPGGELIVNAGCRDLVLEIGKHKFSANLIVLDS
jgi:hypothetical protein